MFSRVALSAEKPGMTRQKQFGFVSINAEKLPDAMDVMNKTYLVVGVLDLLGFVRYKRNQYD